MTFIDYGTLEAIPAARFRSTKPYPWKNPEAVLTQAGFSELQKNLADLSLFERFFGRERPYGQKPHDRFELKYRNGLPLPGAWESFLAELSGPRYRAELARLFGVTNFQLRFRWLYSIAGCSVSPHCDAASK